MKLPTTFIPLALAWFGKPGENDWADLKYSALTVISSLSLWKLPPLVEIEVFLVVFKFRDTRLIASCHRFWKIVIWWGYVIKMHISTVYCKLSTHHRFFVCLNSHFNDHLVFIACNFYILWKLGTWITLTLFCYSFVYFNRSKSFNQSKIQFGAIMLSVFTNLLIICL